MNKVIVTVVVFLVVMISTVTTSANSSDWDEGFQSAKLGFPPTACQYSVGEQHKNWKLGWQEANKKN